MSSFLIGTPCSPAGLRTPAHTLDEVPDPRRVHGRYRIGSLPALCLVTALGGAKSVAAIAGFGADSSPELLKRLRFTSTTPNTTTLGRLLGRLDGDALGAWLGRCATVPVEEPGETLRGLAVDGKAVRGSRTDAGGAVYLLASQTVISQRQIQAKGNEIPAFAPLLDRIDLRGMVVTADALHTQHAHAQCLIAAVADHYRPRSEHAIVSSVPPHENASALVSHQPGNPCEKFRIHTVSRPSSMLDTWCSQTFDGMHRGRMIAIRGVHRMTSLSYAQ